MIRASELFTPADDWAFGSAFPGDRAPWEWVALIAGVLRSVEWPPATTRPKIPPGITIEGPVFIDPSVTLPPYAVIHGPAWIGAGSEVRPGAFIRGNVIVGRRCVLGNACEYKNCLLLDNVQTPHFNYVGDSVLGNGAHLGAGVICANLRIDQKPVPVRQPDGRRVDSGLQKLGAMLGDGAEVGCNVALQPGTILGKRSVVLPGQAFDGYLEADTIAYVSSQVRRLPRRSRDSNE